MTSEVLSVVIPVYRSEAYVERTVRELVAALEGVVAFEIVLVNDGSPDGVGGVLERLCSEDPRVRCLQLGGNLGQHRATLLGFARTRGDVVVTLDDDGQNPPSAALAVAGALRAGDLDVVYGRFGAVRQSRARRLASRANRWMSAAVLGNRTGIAITNVRAIRGELARAIGATESVHPYIDAMLFRATRRIAEVAVEHRPRDAGASTYGLAALLRLWFSHATTLSALPLKIASAGCFAASGLGFLVGAIQLVRALAEDGAPPGWLSLFCAVTFLFSLLFAFLGIVSAYLGRMYVAMNSRGLVWERRPRAAQLPRARAVGKGP